MEISNLEEHLQEAERSQEPSPAGGGDVEQERAEIREAEADHAGDEAQPNDPHARDAADAGQGGPGF